MLHHVINENCLKALPSLKKKIDVTFLDPPFNQDKKYKFHNDKMLEKDYWLMMEEVCLKVFKISNNGAALYFMQREKNTEFVLSTLRKTGWVFQNLIIWKKKSSAVPVPNKFGKQYQIIAYAIKGKRPKTFNRLRIDPVLPANYKFKRENGIYLTDIWDDIRELTSGFFSGNEAIRLPNGERFHKQQAPLALLLRILLISSKVGDTILDPFAGTGTTAVVAKQLNRNSFSLEIDPENINLIKRRVEKIADEDKIIKYYQDYIYTKNLENIWGKNSSKRKAIKEQEKYLTLF